jgi:hypothetical protein
VQHHRDHALSGRCGAPPPPAFALGQADPCSATRQDHRSHTNEVPRRSLSRPGGVAGVRRKSVGTGADVSTPAGPAGRSGTDRWVVSSGHGRAGTRRLDLGERQLPTEHKVRCSKLFGDQARPPVSWQVASKAARGVTAREAFQRGPQTRHQLACPPGAPGDDTGAPWRTARNLCNA